MKPAKEIPSRITVHVPLKFVARGGRKAIFVPISDTPSPFQANHNNALIKALARAHRWRKLIEDGEYASITELAHAKGVNQSYACRLLRLTLLAPDIVTAILDGRKGSNLSLKRTMQPFPAEWTRQHNEHLRHANGMCRVPLKSKVVVVTAVLPDTARANAKKLAGAAKTNFTTKCVKDAVGG